MPDIVLLLTLVGMAAFIQTVSGFAFGLVCMAGVGALGLLPIADAALLVSLLTLVNIVFALPGRVFQTNWRAVALILLSGAPAIGVGLYVLQQLSEQSAAGLKMVLGLCIGLCCMMMLRRPGTALITSASDKKTGLLAAGAFGGLLGGMFSTFGPPVIYLLYRQGWSAPVLRATLLGLFLFTNAIRSGLVLAQHWPEQSFWHTFFTAAPVVILVTLCSRRISLPSLRLPVMGVLALASISMVVGGMAGVHVE